MAIPIQAIGDAGPRLMKVEEAALRLGISRALAFRLIRDGKLPSVQLAGCRRVTEDDLRAFIESLRR